MLEVFLSTFAEIEQAKMDVERQKQEVARKKEEVAKP